MLELKIVDVEQALACDIAWPDVYFSPEYGRAEAAAGRGRWRCVVGAKGDWLLPFHTTGDDLAQDSASPYGYSGVYAAPTLSRECRTLYWTATLAALRDAGLTSLFLRQTPLLPSPFAQPPGIAVVSGHETFVMHLADVDSTWIGMQGRARTSIRKAQREGFKASVRPAQLSDLTPQAPFRRLYQSTMHRRSARSHYFFTNAYFAQLLRGLGDHLVIAEVHDSNDSVVASALLLEAHPVMHYHLSASLPGAGRFGVTNLLIWEAAQYGSRRGLDRLHLGGGLANGDGLARFKKSFGGETLSFNAYGIVVNDEHYARATELRRISDDRSVPTSYFPPYRGR